MASFFQVEGNVSVREWKQCEDEDEHEDEKH